MLRKTQQSWNSTLKRGKPPQRTRSLPKRKPASAATMARLFVDSQGVGLLEAGGLVRRHVEREGWDIYRPRDAEVVELFRTLHGYWGLCWVCGRETTHLPEVHHIASGGRKSDELTNLIYAGGRFDCGCHDRVQSGRGNLLREVLRAKWTHDRHTLSWFRLFLLLGRVPEFDSLD